MCSYYTVNLTRHFTDNQRDLVSFECIFFSVFLRKHFRHAQRVYVTFSPISCIIFVVYFTYQKCKRQLFNPLLFVDNILKHWITQSSVSGLIRQQILFKKRCLIQRQSHAWLPGTTAATYIKKLDIRTCIITNRIIIHLGLSSKRIYWTQSKSDISDITSTSTNFKSTLQTCL